MTQFPRLTLEVPPSSAHRLRYICDPNGDVVAEVRGSQDIHQQLRLAHMLAVGPEYHEIALDAIEILRAVLDTFEESNGETDEVLSDLIQRLEAAFAKVEPHPFSKPTERPAT